MSANPQVAKIEEVDTPRTSFVTVYAVLAYGEARDSSRARGLLNKYGLRVAPGLYLVPSGEDAVKAAKDAKTLIGERGIVIPISMSVPVADMIKILIDAASRALSEPISSQEALNRLSKLTLLMAHIAQQSGSKALTELSNLFAQLIYVAGASLSKPKVLKKVRSFLQTLKKRKMVAI